MPINLNGGQSPPARGCRAGRGKTYREVV